eukprot:SAG31_NODE_1360_length_8638_cov_55.988055_4_plen_190_part_00
MTPLGGTNVGVLYERGYKQDIENITFASVEIATVAAATTTATTASLKSDDSAKAGCPAPPHGYEVHLGRCIGSGPGSPTCARPLHSNSNPCHNTTVCFEQAAAACRREAACQSFVLRAAGANCTLDLTYHGFSWHTYTHGSAAATVPNEGWVTYTKTKGTPVVPAADNATHVDFLSFYGKHSIFTQNEN